MPDVCVVEEREEEERELLGAGSARERSHDDFDSFSSRKNETDEYAG